MKIAHVFQSTGLRFDEPGAVQLHILQTLRSLRRRGHHVALLANQEGREILLALKFTDLMPARTDDRAPLGFSGTPGFKVVESGLRRLQSATRLPYLGAYESYRMYEACVKALKDYDLLHERYNFLSMGGLLASQSLGIPYILEVNADLFEQRRFKGEPERGLRKWYGEWTTRLSFKRASAVICVSSGLKAHLARRWGVDREKLVVIPCAADTEAFNRVENGAVLRRALGLGDEPIMMWIGGFYPWHDLEALVASFAWVVERVPAAKLILIGDGNTKSKVEKIARENGLDGAVIFTGKVPHQEIPQWLSMADIALAPSTGLPESRGGTGTPLKVFEYMAAGKPIVATDSPQVREVLADGRDSLLVAPGDVDALGRAMVRLIHDADERLRLGFNARRRALEHHSWEKYGRSVEEVYERVLQEKKTVQA